MRNLEVTLADESVEVFQADNPLEDYGPRYDSDGSLTIMKYDDDGTGASEVSEAQHFGPGEWTGVREW